MDEIKLILDNANKCRDINDFENALNFYKKAIKLSPNNTKILYEIATLERSIGNLVSATDYFYKVINIEPENTKAHRMLSTLINYNNNNDHLNIMLKLLKSKNINQIKLIDLDFALGKAYEDKGEYKKSFNHYKNANNIKYKINGSNIDNLKKHFLQILEAYKKINFSIKPLNIISKKKIIFICGMQRSGSTLVEQIISKHKDVYGANELNILLSSIRKNFLTNFELDYIKILEKIKSKDNVIEKAYKKFTSNLNITEPNLTDKANENFKWIGIIKLFLPNSIVIHCERDRADTCFSIYKNNFNSKNMNWSFIPDHISKYYDLYQNIIKFWRTECGDFIYDIRYERLINNSENEIKELINKCNLEWDENCLKYYNNNKTLIKTTSAVQARMPIYKKSINNYLNYKDFISFN